MVTHSVLLTVLPWRCLRPGMVLTTEGLSLVANLTAYEACESQRSENPIRRTVIYLPFFFFARLGAVFC